MIEKMLLSDDPAAATQMEWEDPVLVRARVLSFPNSSVQPQGQGTIMEVWTMCTDHVSELTSIHLSHGDDLEEGWPIRAPYCFGWFVHVPEPSDPNDPADWAKDAPELIEIFKQARARGVDWVRFDRDADHVKSLPVFDW
jgi:hypothetical protein